MASIDGAAFGGIALATIFGITFGLSGLVGVGYYTWFNAPPVGGEWWFYIRIGITIIAGIIGAKVLAVIGQIIGLLVGGVIGGTLK